MRNMLFCFIGLIGLSVSVMAEKLPLDSLYRVLDKEIERSPVYVSRHEARLRTLKNLFKEVVNDDEKYTVSMKIFREYKAYMTDSAILYLNKSIDLAEKMGNVEKVIESKSLLAFQCSTTGMYTESLDILASIPRNKLTKSLIPDYYIAYNHVYNELGYYSQDKPLKDIYRQKSEAYMDTLLHVLNPTTEDYLLKKESRLCNEKRPNEALKVNDLRLRNVLPGTHEYAIVTYYRSQIYLQMKNIEMTKYWLALSAITDIRLAIMDHASLWNLADLLNKEGDVQRSYDYIRFSWGATNHFNARIRRWATSGIVSMIDYSYQQISKKKNQSLLTFIIVVSLLSLLLFAVLVYVSNQRKKLALARNNLKKINDELQILNRQLKETNLNLDESNQQLSVVNDKLSVANHKLNESNRVKEEYIGRFLSLCSLYIDKMDGFRKMVNKKMKNNELTDLFQLTKSLDFRDKELDELYSNFDNAFLHLFPNFVNEFNALLNDENKILLQRNERMTTELRIFALIRLGIDDSSKIAEFLHYSVNTIYNYRARVKNGAIGNRDEFENRVKEIGLPKEG